MIAITPRGLLAASVLLFATVAGDPAHGQSPRTLVALLAHADDESAASPVFARYAREGVSVYMIIASDGAAGSGSQGGMLIRPDSGPTGAALATARAEEASCAASSVGMKNPILLGFPDGKLGDYIEDRTRVARLTDRIAKEIERLHPDAVVTWGPDGGTGHPDHRMVSNIATQLLRAGAPGMPERLFYMNFPVEVLRASSPRGEPPFVVPQAKYFTMHVAFTPADFDAAAKAMGCHHSQFTPEMLQRVVPEFRRIWNGKIDFVSSSLSISGTDLFR